jgi:hypothetical protein
MPSYIPIQEILELLKYPYITNKDGDIIPLEEPKKALSREWLLKERVVLKNHIDKQEKALAEIKAKFNTSDLSTDEVRLMFLDWLGEILKKLSLSSKDNAWKEVHDEDKKALTETSDVDKLVEYFDKYRNLETEEVNQIIGRLRKKEKGFSEIKAEFGKCHYDGKNIKLNPHTIRNVLEILKRYKL